ncbi:MAG: SDR family NAD(P)-dependent oxidoreductase [Acidobacteriota bacterium]|nr:SDR family NAD(P)-dependent oxidoreductase [Acidobacteriota bacterium]
MSTTSPFSLAGMDVVVIGGASGIGEASARLAARSGARVVVADRDEAAAGRVVAAIAREGGTAVAREVDIRSGQSVGNLFTGLESEGFQPRGLVSTPGVNVRKRLADTNEEEFERVVSLNLKGTFHALRDGAASLARSGGGSIVLLSSIRSQVVEAGQGVYAATKAGIVQLARTAAAEWAASGVRVNALAPGVVETPLTAQIEKRPDWKQAYTDKTLLGRWASAEEMAAPTVFLLSPAASYVTGSVLFADGGWTAVDGRFDPL